MPTQTVELTAEQAELIERLVRSGRYQSVDEAVSDGLDVLIADDARALDRFRDEIDCGIGEIGAGRSTTFDASSDLRSHLDRLTEITLKA